MKNNKGLLLLFAVAVLGLAWYLFSEKTTKEDADATDQANTEAGKKKVNSQQEEQKAKDRMKGGGDQISQAFTDCFEIPAQFPHYDDTAVPRSTIDLLNAAKVRMSGMTEERVRGFFKAIDVAPRAGTIISYLGAAKVWEYLNSQDGQLPYDLVLLGASRCQSALSLV